MARCTPIFRAVVILSSMAVTASIRSDAPTAFFGDPEKTLLGLDGVFVFGAATDNPKIADTGVTSDWVRQVAELRLRRNGIRVLTKDEWLKLPGNPAVTISVDAKTGRDGLERLVAETITASFNQRVVLERDPTIKVFAPTWQDVSFGTVGIGSFKAGAQGVIEDEIDSLSNVFLAQNPKK